MYLLTCDLINSKQDNLKIIDAIDNHAILDIINKFGINERYIEINGGDQIRILFQNSQIAIKLIVHILSLLADHKMHARCYLSSGHEIEMENLSIATATGQLFYDNKQLEQMTDKRQTKNYIYFSSVDQESTQLGQLLFSALSELCLAKATYLKTLYMYVYEQKTQAVISEELNKSQSTINNQLIKTHAALFKDFEVEIKKILDRGYSE